METKRCTKCDKEQPLTEFANDKSRPDGRFPQCRSCTREDSKRRRHERAERALLTGLPEKLVSTKRCCRCKKTKHWTEFSSNPGNADGLRGDCKQCHASNEKQRQANMDTRRKSVLLAQRRFREKQTPEQRHHQYLKSTYGITREQFDARFEAQGRACAACKRTRVAAKRGTRSPWCVDHCHASNWVRSILCWECNTALGLVREDPGRIKALLAYVEQKCAPMKVWHELLK